MTTPTLFSEIAEPDGHTLALWHRATSRSTWRRVATGRTTQEMLTHMDQAGAGGFAILPIDQKPRSDTL